MSYTPRVLRALRRGTPFNNILQYLDELKHQLDRIEARQVHVPAAPQPYTVPYPQPQPWWAPNQGPFWVISSSEGTQTFNATNKCQCLCHVEPGVSHVNPCCNFPPAK